MTRAFVVCMLLGLSLSACHEDVLVPLGGTPAAPRALVVSYYGGAVTVAWELAPGWNGEAFRIYSRRITDADYFFIAEVTSCSGGLCSYEDSNVVSDETYEYYVAAVDPDSGIETATASTVQVFVPTPTPPPVPDATLVTALDGANYLTWGTASRGAADFSHYKVYQDDAGTSYLLGETDSEGFLDLLAANGETYDYFVTSVDTDGHESGGSFAAAGTPRPDYHGEIVYDDITRPDASGFRFVDDESLIGVTSGSDTGIHFRFETDASGWWLVPGSGTSIYAAGFTTSLKCGVGADFDCTDVSVAPAAGYTTTDAELFPADTYVLRVTGDDGLTHYGVIRVELLEFDQAGDARMIFDWAYQLQANNPNLVSPGAN